MERRHKLTSGCEKRDVLHNVVTNTIELQVAICNIAAYLNVPKPFHYTQTVSGLLNERDDIAE
jgi:hypothetical protein